MINARNEQWLKKILADCFPDGMQPAAGEKSLRGFRILVINLVKNLEQRVEQIQALCGKETKKELKERIDILAKQLFYLRRFCQGRKGKGERDV